MLNLQGRLKRRHIGQKKRGRKRKMRTKRKRLKMPAMSDEVRLLQRLPKKLSLKGHQ